MPRVGTVVVPYLQAPSAVQMLRYAAHCYVSGIRLSTAPQQAVGMKGRNEEALTASVDLLPRLLHLMTFEDRDGEAYQCICGVVTQCICTGP
jgi:hypothetical protein